MRKVLDHVSSPLGLIALGLTVCGLDRWTKAVVAAAYPLHASEPVIPGFFNLVHRRNTGIAFSFFADSGPIVREWILPAASAGAIVFVAFYFWKLSRGAAALRIALALVLAGAAGNLYDRAAYGYVTDFLDFYVGTWHWPAFNVADSAITVGAGLLLLDSFRKPSEAAAGEPEAASG